MLSSKIFLLNYDINKKVSHDGSSFFFHFFFFLLKNKNNEDGEYKIKGFFYFSNDNGLWIAKMKARNTEEKWDIEKYKLKLKSCTEVIKVSVSYKSNEKCTTQSGGLWVIRTWNRKKRNIKWMNNKVKKLKRQKRRKFQGFIILLFYQNQ